MYIKGTTLYYVHTDHLGRPEAITNSSKSVVWRAEPTTFGTRNVVSSSIGAFNIGFPGQYWDSEKQSWYNLNRDYDPETGRYLQSDPIGLAGGMNAYAYVEGNPLIFFDELGLCREVSSLTSGRVFRVGYQDPNNPNTGLGWRISIMNSDGQTYDQYGHMDPGSTVAVGTIVNVGDVIGSYADPTNGRSSGPHVHHERRNSSGGIVDPGTQSPLSNGVATSMFGETDSMHSNPHQGNDWVDSGGDCGCS
ncbi:MULTISPECIES: RHS repeat-associated core domain-containing protein [Gammaproteobacteria]|uniref:RHS repeat-associated core domain-containing protein n=1 Tax=Gammaproteobacteria TaxID=1236 RepID=UPI000F80A612|nr:MULTISPECIES: RHS repeat-associated core domain-containing protein [Gammaproteobacteria]RTE86190.1 hypothetical protein DQX04_06360 [Aliidiomarina sp. B3213]TCZ91542.1 hypothetical protein EYQ95_06370 [Lysobacter sp. N42]